MNINEAILLSNMGLPPCSYNPIPVKPQDLLVNPQDMPEPTALISYWKRIYEQEPKKLLPGWKTTNILDREDDNPWLPLRNKTGNFWLDRK